MEKIIHYFYDNKNVWKKSVSSTFRVCYKSWLQKCPDYKIMLWHDKMPEFKEMLAQSRFLRECYRMKMWAFVSDYVRYYAVYKYGGIYLDTDVELLKNFDDYLNLPFFCSIEGDILDGENIPEPAVLGGKAGHPILKEILDFYNSEEIFQMDNFIAPVILRKVLQKRTNFSKIEYTTKRIQKKAEKYYNPEQKVKAVNDIEIYKNQKIYKDEEAGIYIYPSEYFCPTWPCFGMDAFTEKTVAIHWNQSSWWKFFSGNQFIYLRSLRFNNKLKRFIYIHNKRIANYLTCLIFIKSLRKKGRKRLVEKFRTMKV